MIEDSLSRQELGFLGEVPESPERIRSHLQDYLAFLTRLVPSSLSIFSSRLHWAMQSCQQKRLVMVGRGAEGVALELTRTMAAQERYPIILQQTLDDSGFCHEMEGFQLYFNRFHRLHPRQAREALSQCVTQRKGVAVAEWVSRSGSGLLIVILATVAMPFLTPFFAPVSFRRYFFTYLLPLYPVIFFWGGCVSCFRAYSPSELEELVSPFRNSDYQWEVGGAPFLKIFSLRYLIGYPQKKGY